MHGSDMSRSGSGGDWVLLTYRLPREPSTPRITLWRKLRQLGVAQLGDGLVALPADARTQEQLVWLTEFVREAGGAASLWAAKPLSPSDEREIAARMSTDRASEYAAVHARARTAAALEPGQRQRALRNLRQELRRIRRRDFFPPAERDAAVAAVERLSELVLEGRPSAQPKEPGSLRRRTHASRARKAAR